MSSDKLAEFLHSKPEEPYKFAAILTDKTRQLQPLIVMNGAGRRHVSLPFEPSMPPDADQSTEEGKLSG